MDDGGRRTTPRLPAEGAGGAPSAGSAVRRGGSRSATPSAGALVLVPAEPLLARRPRRVPAGREVLVGPAVGVGPGFALARRRPPRLVPALGHRIPLDPWTAPHRSALVQLRAQLEHPVAVVLAIRMAGLAAVPCLTIRVPLMVRRTVRSKRS